MKLKFFKLFLPVGGVILITIDIIGFNGSPVFNKTDGRGQLVSSFSEEPVDNQLLTEKNGPSKNPPERIIIPGVGIDLPVKEAKVVNGYWEVFPTGAGWGIGSGYPGEKGNQVIFSHARKGMFLPLRQVRKEDNVYVLTRDKWYIYKITDIKGVLPSQIEVVAPTPDETLTLFTCTGYGDSKRLIVIAKKV